MGRNVMDKITQKRALQFALPRCYNDDQIREDGAVSGTCRMFRLFG
jgi:hypothetical protein